MATINVVRSDATSSTDGDHHSGNYGLRKRCLSQFEVLSQSVAVIAPSASMAAIIPLVFVSAGNATWLAYLLTGVGLILVGMNASLKAGHLGVKGSAFVVIADELKATADQVSNGASRLKPILDGIERSANDLKQLRVDGDPTQLAKLEPSILHAIREIEAESRPRWI